MGVYEVLPVNVGFVYTVVTLIMLIALSAYTLLVISKRQKTLEEPKVCKNTHTISSNSKAM